MKKIAFSMMILSFLYAHAVSPGGQKDFAKRVLEDASLVVPGIGSEKIVLGKHNRYPLSQSHLRMLWQARGFH